MLYLRKITFSDATKAQCLIDVGGTFSLKLLFKSKCHETRQHAGGNCIFNNMHRWKQKSIQCKKCMKKIFTHAICMKFQHLHLWCHTYLYTHHCFLLQSDPLPCKHSFTAKFAFYIDYVIQKWKMIIFSRLQWYDSCGPCALPHWTSIEHATRIHLISCSSEGVWSQLSVLVRDFGLDQSQFWQDSWVSWLKRNNSR